ncbi:MAG: NAD(P)/FAD-dependent oxidoreductase [Candidatus Thorarchaeota archaeon]|nr:NAD(P)/FAD-dependent oxidoreductase [Candidatus Thorarchaeota archaeon]
MYDVAVVGAGPAGSTAALGIARSGLKTIVIERRTEIGVPVQCGELLPTPHEMKDLFPSAPRAQRLARVPSEVIVNKCKIMRLVSPSGHKYDFRLHANIVDRTRLDQHFARLAQNAGAEIVLQTRAVRRDPDNTLHLRGPKGSSKIKARVVVGADGPRSMVAQSIGNRYDNPSFELSQTMSFTLADVNTDPNVAEMYFGEHVAPGGYAWVIPRGSHEANVGLGVRGAFAAPDRPLRDYLHSFVKRDPLVAPRMRGGKIVRRIGATVPVAGPVERTWSDNVVLVGDAAGHVMASNGGGIPTAMVGGELAAEAVVAHLEKRTSLRLYEQAWKQEMGRELETALAVLRVADQVMRADAITEVCMRLAGSYFLEPLIRCRLPLAVEFASKTLVKTLQTIF